MDDRRIQHQIRNFERAINEYQFNEPFSRFLTRFYKSNRQMGSSDRKMTSRLCYNYFRLGNAFDGVDLIEKLIIAEFLCENESSLVLLHKPDWSNKMTDTLAHKLEIVEKEYGSFLNDVFPFYCELSKDIKAESFQKSFVVQPDLFIRIKRGVVEKVQAELEEWEIDYEKIGDTTLKLSNGVKLQNLKKIQSDFEVQDLSSQRTIEFIKAESKQHWWDCCAASGGKSLMLLDKFPDIKLLVSDIRLSILRNLEERFDAANIRTPYRKKILDLSQPVNHLMKNELFDGIVLDAPCSGSGTWGRTPEMIHQFKEHQINEYASLQKKIASNVVPFLKQNGQLIYITCSVFEKENEAVTAYISKELGLILQEQKILVGYEDRADSMFVARFTKH